MGVWPRLSKRSLLEEGFGREGLRSPHTLMVPMSASIHTQLTKQYRRSDISFSPQMIGMVAFKIKPLKRTEINLNNKYVSKQYLDNTSNDKRKLNAYFVQDIRIDYSKILKKGTIISFFIQGNNIFSKKYEPNGYTFSYIYGGRLTTENYYYPMATFNLMSGVNVKL